ncbi:MAG: TetR/AcrR family transcriptional regulator, partial [Janthinobacterium lividum]
MVWVDMTSSSPTCPVLFPVHCSDYTERCYGKQRASVRADAQKNYDHLLAVAEVVVGEQGADASLRDVARRADVGLATLYRHFPTREALLAALLGTGFERLASWADELEATSSPGQALYSWLKEFVDCAATYRGVVGLMAAAIDEPRSALHASCIRMRAAGARLLERAQAAGVARRDVDG